MVPAVGGIGPRSAGQLLFGIGPNGKKLVDDRLERGAFAAQVAPGVGDLFGGKQHGPDAVAGAFGFRGWSFLLGFELGCVSLDAFPFGFPPFGFIVRKIF